MKTDKMDRKRELRDRRGSTLLLVILIGTALSLLIASNLKWGSEEQNINERTFFRMKSQNGAESLVASGTAQLVNRWRDEVDFPLDELTTENDPLVIPDSFTAFFAGTPIRSQDLELIGGNITPGQWVYISPLDVGNGNDPFRGRLVYSRLAQIIAKAATQAPLTQGDGEIDSIDAYASQILQIRDSPIFSNAVFYNMDLEFHPGPRMDMKGPVHTNGQLYTSAVNNLYFHERVTTAGQYLHRLAPGHPEGPQGGRVWFKDSTGTFVTDYRGTGDTKVQSSYFDSLDPDWFSIALNRWGGNLLSVEHGIAELTPIGYDNYVRDNPDTPEIDDQLNYAYAIIEPHQKFRNGNNDKYKGFAGEREKYAQKAGLTIRLHESEPGVNPNKKFQLSPNYWVTFHRIDRIDDSDPTSVPVFNEGNGNFTERTLRVDSGFVTSILRMEEYSENGVGVPTSGFFDARRGENLDVLHFDVGEFRKGVDNTHPDYVGEGSDKVWTGGGGGRFIPPDHYNGTVYVEFPTDESLPDRPDNILVSKRNLGLQVDNGSVVPNPDYNIPGGSGFTLATNNAMYVKGHFNSDGNPLTGSSTMADDPSDPNPPASLVADSFTVLSELWDPTKSKLNKNTRIAIFNEITAAIMAGNYITNKAGSGLASGGNHNFPRFLEKWSGITFRYRGSMVALYENEVATTSYNTSYYSPPIRDWGFYEQFSALSNAQPPSTPRIRSFRGLDFKFLTEDEYNTIKADIEGGP